MTALPTSETAKPDPTPPRAPMALWAGVIGSPVAWAVQFELNYLLVPWVCTSKHRWVFPVVTGVFVLLAAAGALLSWRDYISAGKGSPDATDGGPVARTRLL